MARRRSPQEEKLLSYTRDRRNRYGENDKASRKGVPRAKSRVSRRNRRAEAVALSGGRTTADLDAGADVQERVERNRRARWAKAPDVPLATEVLYKMGRRSARGDGAADERAERVRSRLRGAPRRR
ncbi:hypothetical protein ABZ249_12815 [Nocardiopsis sp. NPDC006139]|uniref:hypothetical protein n=1 Tax=Nocardiopsis sp. NPDC006139 TaxID=3154578 RepID=UPI0033A304CC